MALYWHFKNKDELLDAVANRLWTLVDTEVDPEQPWHARLRTLMGSMIEVLRGHPPAASLLMTTQPDAAEGCFDVMEVALRTLADAGFSPGEGAAVCRHGLRTVTTLAIGDPGLKPQQTPDEAAEFIRHKRISLETLPRARYPHVVAAAAPLTEIENPDAFFAFGIDLFVAGVQALAARK